MYTFAMLVQGLSPWVCGHSGPLARGLALEGIRALPWEDGPPQRHTAYVGDPAQVRDLLLRWPEREGLLLLVCGADPALGEMVQARRSFAVFCCLSPETLLSQAMEELFSFTRWTSQLHALSIHQKDPKKLLSAAAERLRAPIFILNSGYRLICSTVGFSFEHPLIAQLLSTGYLSAQHLDGLVCGQLAKGGGDCLETVWEGRNYCVMLELRHRGNTFARLLVVTQDSQPQPQLSDLAVLLGSHVQEHYLIHDQDQLSSDAAFSCLVGDLIDLKITSEEELQGRLFRLPHLPERFFTCVVVAFQTELEYVPLGLVSQALGQIFPSASVAAYHGDLIVFAYRHDQSNRPIHDAAALESLLDRHDAFASFGNYTRFLRSARQHYLQGRAALDLGRALHPGQRIFLYEQYTVYHLIDLCARHGFEFHETKLIYLCTAKYTALMRHDQDKGDDLCQILQVYIQNNCNTSQTAKQLHFHRNTIINKVSKIESILGERLNDWDLQFKLMLSAAVEEYARCCAKRDLLHPHPPDGPR